MEGLSKREADALAASVVVPWNLYALRREWNATKDCVAPWWAANSKEAYSSGLHSLARALGAYVDSASGKRTGPRMGWPRRKKRRSRDSCRFTTGSFGVVDAHHIALPRIAPASEGVKTHEPTTRLATRLADATARILSATLSVEAGRWFVSFTCEVCREALPRPTGPVVGVDLGVSSLAALLTGDKVPNPKALPRYARTMARQSRRCSRRQRGSRRHAQSRATLARTHARVAHVRRDAMHRLTTSLARNHSTVVVERLAVANLLRRPAPKPDPERPGQHLRNGRRARAGLNRGIHDASMAELRRQLTYKCRWYGSTLVVADVFFPSSKTCSGCGWRKPSLSLSQRLFVCENPKCRLVMDRDLNASLNLKALVASVGTGSGPGTCPPNGANARGEERLQPGNGRCSSMNREAGTGSMESGTGTAVCKGRLPEPEATDDR